MLDSGKIINHLKDLKMVAGLYKEAMGEFEQKLEHLIRIFEDLKPFVMVKGGKRGRIQTETKDQG